jgi:hypothetical protein
MSENDDRGACAELGAWLADGVERPASELMPKELRAHAAGCPDCRGLQESAGEGRRWLRSLAPVEPPANLLQDILAATSGASAAAPARPTPEPASPMLEGMAASISVVWAQLLAGLRQPRLVNTAAMAFFSMALLVNLTGVSIDDVRHLRPSSIATRASRGYHATTSQVVRYYENNRFVRELESRLRDLRDTAAPERPRDERAPRSLSPDGSTSVEPEPVLEQEIQVHG